LIKRWGGGGDYTFIGIFLIDDLKNLKPRFRLYGAMTFSR
jgi:hypothetical protein